MQHPQHLSFAIQTAASLTDDLLTILVRSSLFYPPTSGGLSRIDSFQSIQRFLTHVYVQATVVAQERDKVLMSINVVLEGMGGDHSSGTGLYEYDVRYTMEGGESIKA